VSRDCPCPFASGPDQLEFGAWMVPPILEDSIDDQLGRRRRQPDERRAGRAIESIALDRFLREPVLLGSRGVFLAVGFGLFGLDVILLIAQRVRAPILPRNEKSGQVRPRRRAVEFFARFVRPDEVGLESAHQVRSHPR